MVGPEHCPALALAGVCPEPSSQVSQDGANGAGERRPGVQVKGLVFRAQVSGGVARARAVPFGRVSAVYSGPRGALLSCTRTYPSGLGRGCEGPCARCCQVHALEEWPGHRCRVWVKEPACFVAG